MHNFTIERLQGLSDAQVENISLLCKRAFAGDVAFNAMLGGDWSLHLDLCRAITRATALEGELYVVSLGDEIVSTASWFAPDMHLFMTPEQRALGFDDVFSKLSPETQIWHTTTYPEVIKNLEAGLFTNEERKKRWWLYNLATDPAHQRKGFATALIDTFYSKVKENGMFLGVAPATDVNVKVYTSMGFSERGSASLPSAAGEDLPVHVMTRETDR